MCQHGRNEQIGYAMENYPYVSEGTFKAARIEACKHCGYTINPGQPNHPDCVAKRIAALEAALHQINAHNDSPARFNKEIQDVLNSVIDTSDVKFANQ